MTTLYIKTHNVTGVKYFGKTTEDDAHKYKGSGIYWKRHIKKHGYDVSTELYAKFDETDDVQRLILVETALLFSLENNIVESKEWANMKPENGLDGNSKGAKHTDETKSKMSKAKIGKNNQMFDKTHSDETKAKNSTANSGENHPMFGKTHSDETKAKMSSAQTGKTHSDETKAKMSEAKQNMSDETKANISAGKTSKIFINNVIKNKMIKPEDLSEYEKMGWCKGKINKKI